MGAHKTGTSLVQKYCRDNLALLRREKLVYLARGEMNDLIGWGAELRDTPDLLASRLRALTRNRFVRDVIASHENTIGRPFLARVGPTLYPQAPELIEALAEVLRPYRVRIVLSIRPQDEFLESYYLQTIQVGKHYTFEKWLSGIDLDAISWRPLVTVLHDAFGAENVELMDFRRIREGQDAYLRYFFSLADPDLDLPISYEPTRNASISGKGLELALAANGFLRNGPERKSMRVFLQSNFSNRDYPRPVLLSDEQKHWLRERYNPEYDELTMSNVG